MAPHIGQFCAKRAKDVQSSVSLSADTVNLSLDDSRFSATHINTIVFAIVIVPFSGSERSRWVWHAELDVSVYPFGNANVKLKHVSSRFPVTLIQVRTRDVHVTAPRIESNPDVYGFLKADVLDAHGSQNAAFGDVTALQQHHVILKPRSERLEISAGLIEPQTQP